MQEIKQLSRRAEMVAAGPAAGSGAGRLLVYRRLVDLLDRRLELGVELLVGLVFGWALCWLSRREVLRLAAGRYEFVEHAVDGAERDRKMALSLFQMRRSAGEL
jgi:hypothetical protein